MVSLYYWRMIILMETCSDVELHEFLLTIGTAFIINFKKHFCWVILEEQLLTVGLMEYLLGGVIAFFAFK